ncbi:SAP domain-containing protein [Lactiplantibacillus plantarum]|uniref:SAP domain-containing protein n=1 Tax=Lactiplantibacillus plantarum TaxID=1590 RepID=UPI001AAF5A17|nr:SAP domain-containing protein [Lactiplantibacillus plantarum]MBO2729367.1 hypothetical protein [Lactiplantibacillus plantarum]
MVKLTPQEFKSKYYYKTDLVELCRKFGLPVFGTKAELNGYVLKFLEGVPVNQIKPVRSPLRKTKLTTNEITLNTPLVGTGFSFNEDTRKFFAAYFGVEKFSFKKEMAIIKRQAEIDHDTTKTVGDLLKEYQDIKAEKKGSNIANTTPEESTYQWNNFVRAFSLSKKSNLFQHKMKVASILWVASRILCK